jgi:hypothetical protein
MDSNATQVKPIALQQLAAMLANPPIYAQTLATTESRDSASKR